LRSQIQIALANSRRCVPPDFFRATLGNNTKINAAALPSEVFDICTPTEGSREVFKAPRDKKWLALDVISTAGIDTFSFSVDEHPMWVYAVDAHYIEPLEVDVLTVANGDRYSVFIQLNKEGGNYAIRVASKAATQVIDTFAVLAYEDKNPSHACGNTTHVEVVSSVPSIDRIGEPWGPNVTVFNQAEMKSFPPQFPQPAPAADQTFFMHMGTIKNSFTWALNSTPLYHSMLDDRHQPLLWEPPARTISGEGNIVTKNNTWIDLVFISHQPLAPPHPIHKHSNKAFILGTGTGFFMWKSVAEAVEEIPQNFNLVDPPFRDGFVVPPSRFEPVWLAVRYQVVNPGAFMLHCHIQSHLNGGMAMVMLDGVDKWPTVPEDCKN
jgi:FtsP/CotA-like multicopper oxidase with cupredoxin domain